MSILESIDITKLEYVGSGSNNVCFTYGDYAIKLGNTTSFEHDVFTYAASHGCAIPMLEYHEKLNMTDDMRAKLMEAYHANTRYSTAKWYALEDTINIAIFPKVIPVIAYDQYPASDEIMTMVIELRKRYNDIVKSENKDSDYYWEDAHEWNIGYYNNTVVIIDF